jgi:hypothetical protein
MGVKNSDTSFFEESGNKKYPRSKEFAIMPFAKIDFDNYFRATFI